MVYRSISRGFKGFLCCILFCVLEMPGPFEVSGQMIWLEVLFLRVSQGWNHRFKHGGSNNRHDVQKGTQWPEEHMKPEVEKPSKRVSFPFTNHKVVEERQNGGTVFAERDSHHSHGWIPILSP